MGIALTILSTAVGVVSSIAQASAQASAARADFNAQQDALRTELEVLKSEERLSEVQALQDEEDRRRELRSAVSSSRAFLAASGGSVDAGSGAAIQRDFLEQGESDIENIKLMGQVTSRRLNLTALSSLQANEARRKSAGRTIRAAQLGGGLGAGASLFEGIAKIREQG